MWMDVSQTMIGVHLAPFPKPISSITDDFPTEQNHKGWQVIYYALLTKIPVTSKQHSNSAYTTVCTLLQKF